MSEYKKKGQIDIYKQEKKKKTNWFKEVIEIIGGLAIWFVIVMVLVELFAK